MPQSYAVLDNGGIGGRPGKGKKKQRAFVGKYLASKGVEKNVAGERSKREMKLRAEGRAAFKAKKDKKSGSGAAKSVTPKKPTKNTFPQGKPKGIGKGY